MFLKGNESEWTWNWDCRMVLVDARTNIQCQFQDLICKASGQECRKGITSMNSGQE